tara:strand:- start:7274 stop:8686 length:1413 start_codon:yes stop_codon:yes gene_type:complete
MNDAANHPNGEVWPPDDICIFEGYVTGAGLQKTRGTISLMLQARHWLSDIAYSSCLSANSHPGNPLDYLFPSSLPGAGSALGAGPAFMTSHIDHELTRFDLQTDFWVRGLHEWFLKLADEDFLDLHKISSQRGSLVSASDKNNKSVRRALARMTGGYKYVPLVLDANCNLEDVARAISQAFDQQTFQSFSSTTMWNKLVGEFAPNFMFAICPRVKNAYAVPYVPGLRHPWQVIRANEYTALDSSAQMDRLLRAVGIIGTRGTRTGFNLGPPQSQTSLGGYYSPPHIDDGVIMFKQAPSWLGAMTVPSAYSNSSINYGGVTGSSTSPGQGKKPTVASPSSIQDCQSTLLDRYAETMYVYEMLHGRRGSLAGKLRLDIAPGSSVLIEGSSEGGGTAAGGDALSQSLFATVISVTINLDGQRGHAGTSFQLSHIRSETENSIDGFSVDRPPLWKNEWRGTSLVDNRVPGIGGI